jgi:quercetin dioxygenase-like cupin family protein
VVPRRHEPGRAGVAADAVQRGRRPALEVCIAAMPIIDHHMQPTAAAEEFARVRPLVTQAHGATALTVQEVIMNPGMATRRQSHPVDMAFIMLEGSMQMIVGEEVRTVRAGSTLLAPPGVPYQLVNHTWVPARLWRIYPAVQLETAVVE